MTTLPRGTKDILPAEVGAWRYVEGVLRDLCARFGFAEIRTPLFEHTELFQRGIGDTTDVVEKEMYTFADRGQRSITLRPENTASAVRAFVEHKMYADPDPTKLFYIGPMFRYDRPQAGRQRQFHQFGVEALGIPTPAIDAEVILLAVQILRSLGLRDLQLKINTVGCPNCRPAYRLKLQDYFRPHLERVLLALQSQNLLPASKAAMDVFVVAPKPEVAALTFQTVEKLREAGLKTAYDYRQGSMKSQMKAADRSGAGYVLIFGEDEVARNMVTLRDMKTADKEHNQKEIPLADITTILMTEVQKND